MADIGEDAVRTYLDRKVDRWTVPLFLNAVPTFLLSHVISIVFDNLKVQEEKRKINLVFWGRHIV